MKRFWILFAALVLAATIGFGGGMLILKEGASSADLKEYPATVMDYGEYEPLKLTQGVFVTEYRSIFKKLAKLSAALIKNENLENEKREALLSDALNLAGNYAKYHEYRDKLSVEIEGTRYGAYLSEGDSPFGGGEGYHDIITTGDYIVRDLEELIKALEAAKEGQTIFVPGDAHIDLTPMEKPLVVGKGITLASNRGEVLEDGSVSTGGLVSISVIKKNELFHMEESTRLTGIIVKGASTREHLEHHGRSFAGREAKGHSYYYLLPFYAGIRVIGNNVEIDNCEITSFNYAGISLYIGTKDAHVHHNFIHHNRGQGLGYGVSHHNQSTSIVEYNLFNYQRHSIAGTGDPPMGYIARFNVEMGGDLPGQHNFDMHGGADRGDGTDIAGTYVEMYNNTFLTLRSAPYYKRGVPEEYSVFYHNAMLQVSPLSESKASSYVGTRLTHYDNVYNLADPKVQVGVPLEDVQ